MAYRTVMITTDQPLKNGTGSGTIAPGMALERTSTADQLQAHSVAEGKINGGLISVEDTLQGEGLSDSYSDGEQIRFISFLPGDEAYLYIAQGQNISIGDELVSNGDGYFKKHVNDSSSGDQDKVIFATALEACNATAAAARCRAEIS